MQIRLAASLQSDSIVDGEGIRTVIWTQGCPHNCYKCHNPETHDFSDGCLFELDEIKEQIDKLENQDGLTFSGGDPMCQPQACFELALYAKQKGMNIWCYTGYLFENLLKMNNKNVDDFLSTIDVLIDGKFDYNKKTYDSVFRGSSNQRIIDVKESLKQDQTILLTKYDKTKEIEKKVYMYI